MSELEKWKGNFGDDYTTRNRPNWKSCIPFFRDLVFHYPAPTVLEVGCNRGHNLLALRCLGVSVQGVEPNQQAREIAEKEGLPVVDGRAQQLPFRDASFDLVFTAGVLIHISPDDLYGVLYEIHRVSRDYILSIEIPAAKEKRKPYRGSVGLWARNYKAEYLKLYPDLQLVETGVPGEPWTGCHFWLWKK